MRQINFTAGVKHASFWVQEAIAQSISFNEIITSNVEADFADVKEWINEVWSGEFDYCVINDDPTEPVYDIWGWDENTPENEQDWRIQIKIHTTEA